MWDVKLKLKICSSANHWDTDVLHFSILKFKKDKYLVSFQGFILTLFSHSRKWVWLSPKYIACRGRIISEAAHTYFWVTPRFAAWTWKRYHCGVSSFFIINDLWPNMYVLIWCSQMYWSHVIELRKSVCQNYDLFQLSN